MSTSEPGSALDILTAVSPIASAFVAAVAVMLTWRINSAMRRQEQVNNIPRLFLEEYVDAKIARPIQVPDTDGGTTLTTLQEARECVRCLARDRGAWEGFLERSRDERKWENRIAYEISLAIQKVGASVFVGAIPLDFVLATGATQIVSDWGYCHRLVQRIRDDFPPLEATRFYLAKQVGYHRRHGEWLAYVAAIWLHQKWGSVELQQFLDATVPISPDKNRMNNQIAIIRERLDRIQQADQDILSDATAQQLKKILPPNQDW